MARSVESGRPKRRRKSEESGPYMVMRDAQAGKGSEPPPNLPTAELEEVRRRNAELEAEIALLRAPVPRSGRMESDVKSDWREQLATAVTELTKVVGAQHKELSNKRQSTPRATTARPKAAPRVTKSKPPTAEEVLNEEVIEMDAIAQGRMHAATGSGAASSPASAPEGMENYLWPEGTKKEPGAPTDGMDAYLWPNEAGKGPKAPAEGKDAYLWPEGTQSAAGPAPEAPASNAGVGAAPPVEGAVPPGATAGPEATAAAPRPAREKMSESAERAALLAAEQKVQEKDANYYKRSLLDRAVRRTLGVKGKKIAPAEKEVNEAASAYKQKLEKKLGEHLTGPRQGLDEGKTRKTLTPEFAAKVADRYRGSVIHKDVIARSEGARTMAQKEVVAARKEGGFDKALVYLPRRLATLNADLEKKYGATGVRTARITLFAALGVTAGALAAPVSAPTLGAQFGLRVVGGIAGLVLGKEAGKAAGAYYEAGRGKRAAERREASKTQVATTAAQIAEQRKAFNEGSPEAIERKRKIIEAVVAGATGAGVSLPTVYALGLALEEASQIRTPIPEVPEHEIVMPADPPLPKPVAEIPSQEIASPTDPAFPMGTPVPHEAPLQGSAAPIPAEVTPEPLPGRTSLPPEVHPPPIATGPGAPRVLPETIPAPQVEVRAGFGAEAMMKDLWRGLQTKHQSNWVGSGSNVNSDLERLIKADAKSIDGLVHRIALAHGMVEGDKSLVVGKGSVMTFGADGNIELKNSLDKVIPPTPEAPPAATQPVPDPTESSRPVPPQEPAPTTLKPAPGEAPAPPHTSPPGETMQADAGVLAGAAAAMGLVRPESVKAAAKRALAEKPSMQPVPPIAVEAATGEGYDTMIQRIWADVQDKKLNSNMFPVGSDLHRLLIADGRSINRIARLIAADPKHQFTGAPSAGVVLELGPDGNLHALAKGEKPIAPPLKLATVPPVGAPPAESAPTPPVAGEKPDLVAAHLFEREGAFKNSHGLEIDPRASAVYQGAGEAPMAYGGTFAVRLDAAKAYAKQHKGVAVWVQAEQPYTTPDGAAHPWTFAVTYRGFLGGMHVDQPVVDAAHPPPETQMGAIDYETFTKRLYPPSVIS